MFWLKMMGDGCENSLRAMFAGSQVPRPSGRRRMLPYLPVATQVHQMSVVEIILHLVQIYTQVKTQKD